MHKIEMVVERNVSQKCYVTVTLHHVAAGHVDALASRHSSSYDEEASTLTLHCVKHKEVAMIEQALSEINSANNKLNPVPAVESNGSSHNRYVELLSVANKAGLDHGAAWRCAERDIQVKGASPMWEGELICYVYK